MENGMRRKWENIEDESARIVMATAKIIKAQIREMSCSMDSYPTNNDINVNNNAYQELLPILQQSISVDHHQDSHSTNFCWTVFVERCMTSVLPHLLFRLGVELDYIFGWKWLINHFRLQCLLWWLKQNSILSSNFENIISKYPDRVAQSLEDNVNDNVCILDNKNTKTFIWWA